MNLPVSEIWPHLTERDIITSLAEFAARENFQLYFVGGTVRDILLGREVEDLDFAAAGDVLDFARKFAGVAHASFVPLDEERGTARVVFRRGALSMDFATLRGADILEDLAARDFTINAMAVDLGRTVYAHEVEVIDPHSGAEDLNSRLIRLVSTQGVKDDPVRMLRAYRFAATLDFSIHSETSGIIRSSRCLLEFVSAERVRDELFKILATDNSACRLMAMDDVGLLEQMFPEIVPMKGMEQNEYHHLDVWGHSMLALKFLEDCPLPESLEKHRPKAESYLGYEPVKGRVRMSLLKLAALFHDVGKPAARTVDADGRVRFFDHSLEGAEIIMNIGRRLKLAKRETASLGKMVSEHMHPLGLSLFLERQTSPKTKRRAMRRFIHKARSEWLAILLISFADLRATQGQSRGADDLEKLVQLIGEIANIYSRTARSPMPKLVTGADLMEVFDLPASPVVGKHFKQVRAAQIDGIVRTRKNAIEMVGDILSKH